MPRNAIGSKVVVGFTGLLLYGFVVAHLLGNLQVFMGQDAINLYSLHLRDLGPLLWVARIGLIVLFVSHVYLAISLTYRNTDARPHRYVAQQFPSSTVAARTMIYSGLLIFAFLIFHLAHLTFLWFNPESHDWKWTSPHDGRTFHDVYRTVYEGFRVPWYVGLYIVAQIFLAMHLSHAFASMCQTFGLTNGRNEVLIKRLGSALAILIFVGYVSIPTSVTFGLVEKPKVESHAGAEQPATTTKH